MASLSSIALATALLAGLTMGIEPCFKLEGSLSCPDWTQFYIKSSFVSSSSLRLHTPKTNSGGVPEFDMMVHNLLDPNNIQFSAKLIDGPTCGTVRSAVSQLSQPLLCAASVTDPVNTICPTQPPPICHHACTRQVDAILALIDANPGCFINATTTNQANFYDARTSLLSTCAKPNLQGEKGYCLLLDAKGETTISLAIFNHN